MKWRKSQSPGVVDCACNDPCACECPEVEVLGEGITMWASMCGHPGFTFGGVTSTNYYKSVTAGGYWESKGYNSSNSCVFESIGGLRWVVHIEYTGTSIYPCSGGIPSGITEIRTDETWSGGSMTSSSTTYSTSTYPDTGTPTSETTSATIFPKECYLTQSSETNRSIVLGDPDNEADAIARGTPDPTFANSSIWQIRTSGRNFLYRDIAYTLTLRGVRPGRDYLVTPLIRRREAFIPNTGAPWESVVVTPEVINFTESDPAWDPSERTYTLPAVPLPLIRGWEYEITGADLETL